MTRHIAWVADEFLMEHGFTITDPGTGYRRIASRGELSFPLEPRCTCEWCPEPQHANYRRVVGAST